MTAPETPTPNATPTPGTSSGPNALSPAGALDARTPPHAMAAQSRRELFWQNVVREMLNALAVTAAASGGRIGVGAAAAASGSAPIHELFDGRMAIITRQGQRIPIADVVPLFACSTNVAKPGERALAADVQCTVFQITTPGGEVHTLPVHEITSIHALSEHLVKRMQAAAQAQAIGLGPPDEDRPFGFAAFTSLARSETTEGDGDGTPDERGAQDRGAQGNS